MEFLKSLVTTHHVGSTVNWKRTERMTRFFMLLLIAADEGQVSWSQRQCRCAKTRNPRESHPAKERNKGELKERTQKIQRGRFLTMCLYAHYFKCPLCFLNHEYLIIFIITSKCQINVAVWMCECFRLHHFQSPFSETDRKWKYFWKMSAPFCRASDYPRDFAFTRFIKSSTQLLLIHDSVGSIKLKVSVYDVPSFFL